MDVFLRAQTVLPAAECLVLCKTKPLVNQVIYKINRLARPHSIDLVLSGTSTLELNRVCTKDQRRPNTKMKNEFNSESVEL